MWEGFAVQRAYHASIQAALDDNKLDDVIDLTAKATEELELLKIELQTLSNAVGELAEAWNNPRGPMFPASIDESKHIAQDIEQDR